MIDCTQKGRLIGGCRFEARFDETPPDQVKFDRATTEGAVAIIRASIRRVYVREVCIRCGATIERQGASAV